MMFTIGLFVSAEQRKLSLIPIPNNIYKKCIKYFSDILATRNDLFG